MRISDWSSDVCSSDLLPQDEVLARILFGKATGELSALEAVQLADSVATLTGVSGGPGVLGEVRSAVGLDRLSVDAGAGGQSSVTAGKYVAEGVFVGVRQGAGGGGSGGSSAPIEIEVTPHVTIESDLGAASARSVGEKVKGRPEERQEGT